MKRKRIISLCLMVPLSLYTIAQEYYDLTRYYLQNSLFDSNYNYTVSQTGNVAEEMLSIDGWTTGHTANYTITGIYQIGTKKTFNGASIPAQNVDGTTEGGVLAISTGWEQSLIFDQDAKLPAGTYRLVSAYYNGDASKTAGRSLFAWIPNSGNAASSDIETFPVSKWTTDTLNFTLSTTTEGKIRIGFRAAANGSANSAKISVDYVKLFRTTPYGDIDVAVYKSKLKTLLSTANSQYGTGTKRGAAVLKAVIDEAQKVYDNQESTVAQIEEVYAKLNEAIEEFKALQTADSTLKSVLTTANNTAKDATGVGIEALNAAISSAQAVYDDANATADQLTQAAADLQSAIDTYLFSNPTGNIPTVITDTRYLRGATMAFGRIKSVTNNGATIKKRGFCCSENSDPTINDIVSTGTISNNGIIYWLKELKPATKYYMRAYVITQGYQVAYGEVIKFYTVPKGNVTYNYSNGGDATINARIKSALDDACYYFNNMCYTTRKFNVDYSPGTPTADCNYTNEPHMNVGPNTSYQRTGTIMHEMQHGLGLQNYSTQWCKSYLRSGDGTGRWLGDRVAEALHFWDNNTTTVLNGDKIHMWPYGINGANEDNGTAQLYLANAMICQALGEDGLEHNYSRHADPYYSLEQEDNVKYYLKNESLERGRYTSYLIPTANGILKWREMTTTEAAANDSTAWYITFTPENQYYQFHNAATGEYLTYSGTVKTMKKEALTANDDWHLMKGRVDVDGQRGYWIIHPTANSWNPACLQANINGATSGASFNIANSAENQRWLIMTISEAEAAEASAVKTMKTSASDILAQIKALTAVPHHEDSEGIDQQTSNAIANIEAGLSGANTIAAVTNLIIEAQETATNFLQNATPTDVNQPFDLTFMVENPSITDGTNGWSTSTTVNYNCAEFYQTTFDFNQTVKELPAGHYGMAVQGFQRPGAQGTCASATVNALIYAGTRSSKLAHIMDGAQTTKVGTGAESLVNSKYIPNDMNAANSYFKKGLYENLVFSSVADNGGSLKIGIKSSSMPNYYWVIFTNFRLYFYGKMDPDITLGIKEIASDHTHSNTIFTLDGRHVSSDTQLRPGLYIVNRKKVIIK